MPNWAARLQHQESRLKEAQNTSAVQLSAAAAER